MKKINKLIVTILSVMVAAVLFSVPISFLMESIANASDSAVDTIAEPDFSTDVNGEDYVFVVIEDEPVALTDSPFHNGISYQIGIIVCLSLLAMTIFSYVLWYTMVRRNIYNYSRIISDSEIRSVLPAKAFVHPFELSAAEVEIEYRAANRYI